MTYLTPPIIPPPLVNQPTNKPTRKVAFGAIGGISGGGLTAVVLWIWNINFPDAQMPHDVAAALAGAVGLAAQTITAYFTKDRAK